MRFVFLILYVCLVVPLVSQERTVGLFLNTADAYKGYTLFSNNQETYLIDNCGLIVNQWSSEYSTFGNVRLREDGSLLRMGISDNEDFRGGGSAGIFEIFTWQGDLIWSYQISDSLQLSHHDIEIMPNGNILALVWERIEAKEVMSLGRNLDNILWMEKIIELEIIGADSANVVWEWKAKDHLIQDEFPDSLNYGVVSEHPERININYTGNVSISNRDWLHLNSIDYNSDLDQIVVSTKHLNEVWVIDHSTTIAQAATSGGGRWGRGGDLLYRYGNPAAYDLQGNRLLSGQHSVSWASNNSLMIFNNNYLQGEQSSIDQWSLPVDNQGNYLREDEKPFGPESLDWQYTAPRFYSNILSSAQRLPNDNVLICEGLNGHFFEVDRAGELLWSYINPTSRNGRIAEQGSRPSTNSVFQVLRYGSDFSGFDERNLEPTFPVELMPIESDCEVVVSADEVGQQTTSLELVENPVSSTLRLSNNGLRSQASLFNLTGMQVGSFDVAQGLNSVDVSYLESGMYFIRVENKSYFQTISLYKE